MAKEHQVMEPCDWEMVAHHMTVCPGAGASNAGVDIWKGTVVWACSCGAFKVTRKED